MTTQRYEYEHQGTRVIVLVRHLAGDRYSVHVDGQPHEVRAHAISDGRLFCRIDGRAHAVDHVQIGQREQLRIDGWTWTLAPAAGRARGGPAAGSGRITAPMTGTVLAVMAAVGDIVEAGQALVVLTAMKMEHKLVADVAGRVAAVTPAAGATVDEGALLVQIEPERA